jgi:hypothetical protein
MKIKLRRTGGFIPLIKAAETEVDLTDKEVVNLLEIIKPDPSEYRIRDGTYYELTIGTRSASVDLDKVPDEYKELFSKLKNDLKIIK